MFWSDEAIILSKNNFNENSIILEAFTLNHGKCVGIVYGGSSRNKKNIIQIANKVSITFRSKNENSKGYFDVELIDPIAPYFFENKKKITCILSATSILKILLPEGQINKTIYKAFEIMLNDLKEENWIVKYINWERFLIKELGFEDNFESKTEKSIKNNLLINKKLLIENFISPNKLKFPLFRNILEDYFV